ncbi:alpha/beta fold hydrolase [Paenibacillus solisilvae]|uniref:Alpha/beta fold hydrolase n=1 Tax=Paenibacillus solisilvae TaxID=2486751 RepID=A0ABW0W5H3_9BACL
MWKRIRTITRYFFFFLIVLIGAGSAYQWFGVREDLKSYTPVGKLYDVMGRKMHLYTEGQGETTVVFAAGWGTANAYVDFYPLYKGLSSQVKIAVYDRFGYGYSDSTGKERSIDAITDEMHELFRISGQKPPYILVGHSLGSLEALRYAQRFPEEVSGIVLVEGGSPEYYASRTPLTIIPYVERALLNIGVIRAFYQVDGFAESLASERNALKLIPDKLKEMDRQSTLIKLADKDMTAEIRQSRKNAKTVLAGNKPLTVPVTVLTADYFGKLSQDKAWMDNEAGLPSWSTAGKQLIVPGTSHYLHHYRPDVVVKEILALVPKQSE